MNLTGQPFALDSVDMHLAGLGDARAVRRAARALNAGVEYASSMAAVAVPHLSVADIIAGVRRRLGLPPAASDLDDPYGIPLIDGVLRESEYPEANVRGLLREIARGVAADLTHRRSPRRGLIKRDINPAAPR